MPGVLQVGADGGSMELLAKLAEERRLLRHLVFPRQGYHCLILPLLNLYQQRDPDPPSQLAQHKIWNLRIIESVDEAGDRWPWLGEVAR